MKVAAIIIGSGWAYWKFVHHRANEPATEMDVEVRFVGKQDCQWIIEITVVLENKRQARLKYEDFQIMARYLLPGDKLEDGGHRNSASFRMRIVTATKPTFTGGCIPTFFNANGKRQRAADLTGVGFSQAPPSPWEAVAPGRTGHATAVQNLAASERIAYSYGVRPGPGFEHRYRSSTVGGLGHGHPAAVALYRAKGWRQSFNSTPRNTPVTGKSRGTLRAPLETPRPVGTMSTTLPSTDA